MTIEEKADKTISNIGSQNPFYYIELKYDIECLPYARPRKGKYGSFYNPRSKYKKELEKLFEEDLINEDTVFPVEGEVELEITIGISKTENIKNSKLKSYLADMGIIKPVVRPDIDNFMKPILDALNNILYIDDGQITKLTGNKVYSENNFLKIEAKYRKTKLKMRGN